MGAGIDGDAQIGPVKVGVDASMSDVFDTLEFGAMLAYRVDNGTWSFMGDATYMGLGAHETHSTPADGEVKGEIDVDQVTLMATFGRRWTEHLEFLFGLAYLDLSANVKLKSVSGGPLNVAAGATRTGSTRRLACSTTGRSAMTGESPCAATSVGSVSDPTSCIT